jgi:KaiC/GvpD/RAD55 family RecA-like ATPase
MLIVIILVATMMPTANVSAQATNSGYVVLYAHTLDSARILNADPTWGGMRTENVSNVVSFKLTPALGMDLQINGAITVTLYMRAGTTLLGNLNFAVSELKSTGEQALVPGAGIQTQILLDKQFLPFTLGIGIIDYKFQKGSSIVLSVQLDAKGTSYLAWDDASTPSSLTIPATDAVRATITTLDSQSHLARIFPTENTTDQARIHLEANVTDSIGAYRLTDAIFAITGPNGTIGRTQPVQRSIDAYAVAYGLNITLPNGSWQISLEIQDPSRHTYTFSDRIWVAPFSQVKVSVVDSSREPLGNATVQISYQQLQTWSSITNATGWTAFALPSSKVLGPFNLTVYWLGVQTVQPLSVIGQTTAVVVVHTLNKPLRVIASGLPVPWATVRVLKGDKILGQGVTGYDGTVTIKDLPSGNYTLNIRYFFSETNLTINIDSSEPSTLTLAVPHQTELLAVGIALASVTLIGLDRKRRKTYPQNSSYFNQMTSGGLPETCFALVVGNSGAGKTILLETLAIEHLSKGPSVYITNTEYPSKIRESMNSLKMMTGDEMAKVTFIDAYSAIGGTSSTERYGVSSHTDLTGLGLQISKCLDETGPNTDVYLDSVSPLLADLRVSYFLSFLNSIAVKVKANNGKLCATTGVAIEKSDLTKIEEVADCVIETQLQESRRGQTRRLRIKKLRGKPYMDKWVSFRVESGKGIVFLTRTRPSKEYSQPKNAQH